MDNQNEQSNKNNKDKPYVSDYLDVKLKSYIEFEEKWADAMAKFLTRSFGSLKFLTLALVFVLLWMIVNLGVVPGINPFDLQSFNILMIIVQLFSIVLSIIVLINQNRETKIDEVYQKMDFEINVRAEHEITKILQMIEEIHKEIGIAKPDKELEEMKEKIDIIEIKEHVEQVIEEENNPGGSI